MSKERYVEAMRRIRSQIANGLALEKIDSNTPGERYMHCSWGLCSMNSEQWPDPEDHKWPDQFIEHGRVSPKHFEMDHECPFAGPQVVQPPNWQGCFYRCAVFQCGLTDRAEAVELYDRKITDETDTKAKPSEVSASTSHTSE